MSLESILSALVGVPCGNVTFSRQAISAESYSGEFVHGLNNISISFDTHELLSKQKFGSIRVISQSADGNQYAKTRYSYSAILLYGEETYLVAQAIADELYCK